MIIYNPDGSVLEEMAVDDNSYRYRAIMGDNALTLYFSLPRHLEIPIGAYTDFQGARYTLVRPEALKMRHSRHFEYTVTMEGTEAKAKRWMFRNPVDGRLKFPLTATPREHLRMFVDNMNSRDSGWSVGSCVEGVERLISYSHNYCLDALRLMAQQFDTEYEISGKVVSLKKVEYNKDAPLALSYGKGNGFKSGVGRGNSGDSLPVEILFVQGGGDNIDPSAYGSQVLLLPKGQTLGYDGNVFSDQDGYVPANGRIYEASADGLSIRRGDKALDSLAEDSLDCSTICPKRVGTISGVVTVDADRNFYDIVDSNIPETLNYSNYLIAGETMTIVFQSGMLAGREFEAKYIHEPSLNRSGEVVKAGRRFEIVPQDIDGQTMPNGTFKPEAGDTYAVFHCALPDAYIRDDETRTGASWDMFREAIRYMYSHEDRQFTFRGELDGIWAKKDWTNIGGKIVIGGYIEFSDERFQPDGVLVRIVGVKDYVNNPHSPTIELSNQTVTGGFSSALKEMENEEVATDQKISDAVRFTKRRYRDALETISALKDAMLDFSEGINPVTVQTMAMLVGDESLQFRFVNSKTNPRPVDHSVSYDPAAKKLSCDAGVLQHLTLGINTLSSSHAAAEYKYWDMAAYESAYLGDVAAYKFYLYAKVSKTGRTGVFVLSRTAIGMDSVTGYYHLLVGVLNSEFEDTRSYVSLYGYTEVLPGRVTVDKIVSSGGTTFWDLLRNTVSWGGKLMYNTEGNNELILSGPLVQTGNGEVTEVGAWCGEWDGERKYALGDEVWCGVDGNVGSYRYVNSVPSKGHPVTDASYWSAYARGIKGDKGDGGQSSFKSIVFKRSNESSVAAPTGGSYASPVPTGWSDGIPDGTAQLWMSTRVLTSDGKTPQESSWTTPRPTTDTSDIDFEFSAVESAPGTPASDPSNWHDTATASDIWMAVRKCKNGVWGGWEVSKVKGEAGADGKDSHSPYIGDNGNWYVYDDARQEYVDSGRTSEGDDGHSPYIDSSTQTWWEWDAAQGEYTDTGIRARGSDGVGVQSTAVSYNTSSSGTDAPVGGWSSGIPSVPPGFYLWTRTVVTYTDGSSSTSYTAARQGTDGEDGNDGASGPAVVFRGTYESGKTYVGNSIRVDAVYYIDRYYVAKTTAGEFSGVIPTSTSKWNTFGASFDSIATGLLLSEEANIANFIFRNQRMVSQAGSEGSENLQLDGVNGVIRLADLLRLDSGALTMYSDGVEKVSVRNSSVGDYDLSLMKKSESISGQQSSATVTTYLPSAGSYVSIGENRLVNKRLGHFDAGDKITVTQGIITLSTPTADVTARFSAPTAQVSICKDGEPVSTQYIVASGTVTSGTSKRMELGGGLAYTVPSGGDGDYTIQILTKGISVKSDSSAMAVTTSFTTLLSYSFNKASFAKSLLGNDGILLTAGAGNTTDSGYLLFNANNLVVGFGNYALKVDKTGISKSSNGGVSFTAL